MDVVSVAVPATEKGKDADGKVQYEEVELNRCLDALLGTEVLEYGCPSCGKSVAGLKCVGLFRFINKPATNKSFSDKRSSPRSQKSSSSMRRSSNSSTGSPPNSVRCPRDATHPRTHHDSK